MREAVQVSVRLWVYVRATVTEDVTVPAPVHVGVSDTDGDLGVGVRLTVELCVPDKTEDRVGVTEREWLDERLPETLGVPVDAKELLKVCVSQGDNVWVGVRLLEYVRERVDVGLGESDTVRRRERECVLLPVPDTEWLVQVRVPVPREMVATTDLVADDVRDSVEGVKVCEGLADRLALRVRVTASGGVAEAVGVAEAERVMDDVCVGWQVGVGVSVGAESEADRVSVRVVDPVMVSREDRVTDDPVWLFVSEKVAA